MGLDDGLSPCPVRLLGVCPEKVVVFILSGGLLGFLRLARDRQAPLGRQLGLLGGCSDRRLHCAFRKECGGVEEVCRKATLPCCSGAKQWSLTRSVGIGGGVGRPWRVHWLTWSPPSELSEAWDSLAT
jgi:hypothetical protein